MAAASDQEMVERIGVAYKSMTHEIHKKIVGQHDVVERVLICIFAAGHTLLIGVPGLAKTLLVNSISEALGVKFRRIQFTPDLMPTDITGTDIIQDNPQTGQREYKFMPGPVFSNILLADEINRTPPKTQAALLEAMQEKQVSVGGKIYKLDKPFFVMATQNPLDQEGTYPLPEAQMDRFLFNIFVDYPDRDDEIEIARNVTSGVSENINSVVTGEEINQYQALIKRAPVADHVLQYAVQLVRSTRPHREESPDFINEYINCAAGPRACLSLISAGKARAILHGRFHVAVEDIKAIANPVLRHRISPNFGAQAEGINSDRLVEMLLEHMESFGIGGGAAVAAPSSVSAKKRKKERA
ncbi:MAG: MoxR family ATPase [Planctomycetes bacterium]|nr:MoxR family ATPase [Planctomycetota bacterium]